MGRTRIAMAALAAALVSGAAWAGIANSPHDLSSTGPNGGLGITEVCLPCHAPHNGKNPTKGPIWNHAIGNLDTGTGFTRKGSAYTLYGTSLLCMGCHDGVTAVGSFTIVNPGVTITAGLAGKKIQEFSWSKTVGGAFVDDLSTDLTATHPSNKVYGALTGTDSTSFHGATSGIIGGVLPLQVGATASVSDTVGCVTCHDAHDNSKGTFLRISNTGSALCLTCHIH